MHGAYGRWVLRAGPQRETQYEQIRHKWLKIAPQLLEHQQVLAKLGDHQRRRAARLPAFTGTALGADSCLRLAAAADFLCSTKSLGGGRWFWHRNELNKLRLRFAAKERGRAEKLPGKNTCLELQ